MVSQKKIRIEIQDSRRELKCKIASVFPRGDRNTAFHFIRKGKPDEMLVTPSEAGGKLYWCNRLGVNYTVVQIAQTDEVNTLGFFETLLHSWRKKRFKKHTSPR